MPQRWKLTIEYDGSGFVGWQRQDIPHSVQEVLEDAIFALSGQRTLVYGSGRTDSGVHAVGQVAHVDLEKDYLPEKIIGALNVHVRPHPVSVIGAEKVPATFHARFDAIMRYYRYVIHNRRAPPVIGSGYMWHVWRPLDIEVMRKAAKYLIGIHDYSAFRASVCQAKNPVRSIERFEIITDGEKIYFDITARSFLHHQVRNMVGTLRKIGDGSWPPETMQEIMESKDRKIAGPTAPAHGLFFMRVDYPDTGNK